MRSMLVSEMSERGYVDVFPTRVCCKKSTYLSDSTVPDNVKVLWKHTSKPSCVNTRVNCSPARPLFSRKCRPEARVIVCTWSRIAYPPFNKDKLAAHCSVDFLARDEMLFFSS